MSFTLETTNIYFNHKLPCCLQSLKGAFDEETEPLLLSVSVLEAIDNSTTLSQ